MKVIYNILNINKGYAGYVRLIGSEKVIIPKYVVGMEFHDRIIEVKFSLS